MCNKLSGHTHIKIKENIFEHIFYEMNMYMSTYMELHRFWTRGITPCQYRYNTVIESHCVHLRNLIEFFNPDNSKQIHDEHKNKEQKQEDKNIVYTHVLVTNCRFTYNDEKYKIKQLINKSVNHLSLKRFAWENNPGKSLSERQMKDIPRVFPLICRRIKYFLLLLENNNIKEKYKSDFANPQIQEILAVLRNQLEEQTALSIKTRPCKAGPTGPAGPTGGQY